MQETYTAVETPHVTPPAAPETAPETGLETRRAYFVAQVDDAQARASDAFAELQTAQAERERAREALDQRRADVAQALAEAQHAATAGLLASDLDARDQARQAELQADALAERTQRDIARGEAALGDLDARAERASAAHVACIVQLGAAREALATEDETATADTLRVRLASAERALMAATADARAHNRRVVARALEAARLANRSSSESAARRSCAALVLPGEDTARTALTASGERRRTFSENGAAVIWADDLSRADATEDDGRARAEYQGAEL